MDSNFHVSKRKMRLTPAFVGALLSVAVTGEAHAAGALPPGGVPDVITVEGGAVSGVRLPALNTRYWLGIPYAASTAGANAWSPPAPRSPWSAPLDATALPAGCYSTDHNPDTAKNQSYDCLNVNVFAPILPAGAPPVPVMVWFYGGAFKEGDNYGPFDIYDGSYIASKHNIVVVAVNYRLGVLGFLVTDSLTGNYGLMDQRAALQWVQRNVQIVGGDPTQVTIWGESAGAMSVGFHLTSPKSAGLFSKAIMESNPAGFNYKNLSEANVYGQTFCQLLNCSTGSTCDTSCIRAAPVDAVLSAWDKAAGNVIDFIIADWNHLLDGFLQFTPVVDGVEVLQEPMAAFQAGNWAKVPLLIGTNSGEGQTFVYDAVNFALPGFLVDLGLDVIFGSGNSKSIREQPRYFTNVTDGRVPLSNVITDYWFRCASTQFATAAYNAGVPAWVYRYDHLFSQANIFPTFGLPEICAEVVCHASELPFVFHNDVPSENATFTPAEVTLSTTMVNYWTSFVKFGNPNTNSTNLFPFPAWDPVARNNIILNITLQTESSAPMCQLWDSIGYYW